VVIIIVLVLIAIGIGFFYLSGFNQAAQPTPSIPPNNVHHFEVKVNDTFAIGEKHG
jgi:hypothetical protein